MQIKNFKKAAKRIQKAIRHRERIILYGDADLDGVASVIILEETIEKIGGKISAVYFPYREKEGYGLNKRALGFLKKYSPALLITVDCGISNFAEVKLAKKMGFEVIIIDHHEILNKLPDASIIVDPKQKGDKYPFKKLANAGIIFKLTHELLKHKFPDSLKENFLSLVALATIFDMMPQEEDNEIFIRQGLKYLKKTARPGLKAFIESSFIKKYKSSREISQKIISVLNSFESKNHLNKTYLLLTSQSISEAKKIAKDLIGENQQKRAEIEKITQEVKNRLAKKTKDLIIFEGNHSWPVSLVGSVASKICNFYQKPTFIFKKNERENRGAVRVSKGQNGVVAMKKCSYLLESYGGHPLAAGFNIKNKNLEKFKRCLIKYFTRH
jgi:single-stranded-DNA-specific exonuclease